MKSSCHIQTDFFWAIIGVENICVAVSQLRLAGLEAEAPQGI